MRALVGHSGFVGSNLKASARFDALFNSRNIDEIRGRAYDLVVCAAAPATMWAANNDPEGDLRNILGLLDHLRSARIGRLAVVSTIAVFDDPAAGYDERRASYETGKAYGRNRRLLEEAARDAFDRVHVLRLPALFGRGVKKNFIFDILNPVPSFLKPEKLRELLSGMAPGDAAMVERFFAPDDALGMQRFDRAEASKTGETAALGEIFAEAGFTALNFTNSQSRFQYYDLARLWGDIERCVALDIEVLNVAAAPLKAGDVYRELTGKDFSNTAPPLYAEDMHSLHAAHWGGSGPYLYSASDTLSALATFYRSQSA